MTEKQKKFLPVKEDKERPVLPLQQWWGNYLMSLKDLSGPREQEQRIKIISQGSFVQEG